MTVPTFTAAAAVVAASDFGDDASVSLLAGARDAARPSRARRGGADAPDRDGLCGTSARTPIQPRSRFAPSCGEQCWTPALVPREAPLACRPCCWRRCARDFLLGEARVQIRVGFEMVYDCPQPTPMIFNLNVHFTRVADLVGVTTWWSTRRSDAAIVYSFATGCTAHSLRQGVSHARLCQCARERYRSPDVIVPQAQQIPVRSAEKRCSSCSEAGLRNRSPFRDGVESLRAGPNGMGRVQAICDYVHRHIAFGYEHARMTRQHWKPFTIGPASAATTHTWPLPSAGA